MATHNPKADGAKSGLQRVKPQMERFIEAARAVEGDDSDDALDRAMDRLDLRHKPKPEKKETDDGRGD